MKTIYVWAVSISLFALGYVSAAPNEPLRLASRTVEWKRGFDKDLEMELRRKDIKFLPALVKFGKPLSVTNLHFLDTSKVSLEEYLGGNCYLALLQAGSTLENKELKNLITSAQPFLPEDRLRISLHTNQFPAWAYDRQNDQLSLLIRFWHSLDDAAVREDLKTLGLTGNRTGADNAWAVFTSPVMLRKLLNVPSIKAIEPAYPPGAPLNNMGRRIANTDEANQASFGAMPPVYQRASGAGVKIAICDTGVDETHPDFAEVTPAGIAGVSRFYKTRPSESFHGTHVASIAAGSGLRSKDFGLPGFYYAGHAPRALVGDYPYWYDYVDEYYPAIVNEGTDVSNHSYRQADTVYNTGPAAGLDLIVRGNAKNSAGLLIPPRPNVWGVGNNGNTARDGFDADMTKWEKGYYSVFTSAKNTISVGSIDTDSGRLSGFSSMGPTFDGRIKPDVVAPGCSNSIPDHGIWAATNGPTRGYAPSFGTSMAAPVVSGIIALMFEEYRKTAPGAVLLPSMCKAILVHTARDMIKTRPFANPYDDPDNPDLPPGASKTLFHAGPDYATGYGLVDAEGARRTVAESDRWSLGTISSTGFSQRWCISVDEGSAELKVVIAWDDLPGSTTTPETAPKLVNDLDLELTPPGGGVIVRPWVLDPLPVTANPGNGALDPISMANLKPAYRGIDRRNNVEMVTVCSPMKGIWRATVKGHYIATGLTQTYSLVSSHPIAMWCAPIRTDFRKFPRYKVFCDVFPKLCNPDYRCLPKLDFIGGRVAFRACGPVRIDEICKYVIDCPGCAGPAWSLCPGFQMNVKGIPPDAHVVIFNDRGDILDHNRASQESRIFNLKGLARGDRHYLFLANEQGEPLDRDVSLAFDFLRN